MSLDAFRTATQAAAADLKNPQQKDIQQEQAEGAEEMQAPNDTSLPLCLSYLCFLCLLLLNVFPPR
jgi:hypothetical protein